MRRRIVLKDFAELEARLLANPLPSDPSLTTGRVPSEPETRELHSARKAAAFRVAYGGALTEYADFMNDRKRRRDDFTRRRQRDTSDE